MTAESGGTTHLDGGHDASLCSRERPFMLLTIGFAVAAEDVRHFPLRALHRSGRSEGLGWCGLHLHRNRARQQIQGARGGADFVARHEQVLRGCGQTAMPEQELNLADVGALFKQVDGKRVAHGMGRDGFWNSGNQTSLPALGRNCVLTDVLA
jgi:hypothetical protein